MAFNLRKEFINSMESESIFQQAINDYPDDDRKIVHGCSRTQDAIVYGDFDNLESFHEHLQHCNGCWQDLPLRYVDEYSQNRKARLAKINLKLLSETAKQELQRKSAKITNIKDPYTAELYPYGDEFYTGKNEFIESKSGSFTLHPIYNPQVWKKIKNEFFNLPASTDGNLKAYFQIDSQQELSFFKRHYGLMEDKKSLEEENYDYRNKLKEEHSDWDLKSIVDEANGALSNYEDSDYDSFRLMQNEYQNLVDQRRKDVVKNVVTWKAIVAKEVKKKTS